MKTRRGLALAGAALALALAPLAARADSGLLVGVDAGSTGIGAMLGYAVSPGFVVRAQTGALDYYSTFNANGDTYTGHLVLNNVLIDGEFHPAGQSFFVAAGGLLNNNAITANTSSAAVTIGNTDYGAGSATARVTWTPFAPYFGIGWSPVRGGLGLDIGGAVQGNSRAVVTSSFGTQVSQSDYALAAQQIENTVNKIQIYPVLSLRYTFRL